jgi:hypothetical protein
MSSDDAWLFPIVRVYFIRRTIQLNASPLDWFRRVSGAIHDYEIPRREVDKLVVGMVFFNCRCGECLERE